MKVYTFDYCCCVYESVSAAVSLHRTKMGAYKAMRKHRLERYNEWCSSGRFYRRQIKEGVFESWKI